MDSLPRMRILVLTSVYPPLGFSGHDERCRQTVNALARRKHQMQVLTSDYRLPPMGVDGEKGVFRELRRFPESSEGSILGVSYAATYAHERFNADSLEHRLSRFKPDVVYVWNMHRLSKSLLFCLQDSGVRVTYDLHSDWLLPENFNRDPWYRWWFDNTSLRSKMYRIVNRLIGRDRRVLGMLPIGEPHTLKMEHSYVVSHWLQTELSAAGLSQVESLPVIHPSVELNKLSTKGDYVRRRHFVWAGRLKEAKGADIAVSAIGLLKERGIDVKLDLFAMGQPIERKATRELIVEAGLIDRITMRGIRPGELPQYYADYDALLYTARTGEVFSMTVLEAMLSGLPCLVSKTGGNQEFLEHGQNALLYEPDNAEALADAIAAFLQLSDNGEGLVQGQIEQLHTTHNADSFCEQIEPLLVDESQSETVR